MAKQEAKHTGNREKTSILCHPNVETGRRGKPFRGVNKVEATDKKEVSAKITYHDKATQTETEEENTIEKILKAITTLSTKVDSMDNEIQKLKTNEDNLKSKASHKDDYKNASYADRRRKNPELKGDDGKLLKTHNICLNTSSTSKRTTMQEITNDLFQFKGVKESDMDEVRDGFYHYLSRKNNLQREL
ncbi:hypothetical protein H5410_014394 [Solanum commersonii]|uniref:Uncharacterized protein n=1 Tax=Solanum commersonii TaxID=4109 RepID=A0A9J5ZR89_SOLCO|nr:hypothetical protein H5410_014394 [Solanum commersonii]